MFIFLGGPPGPSNTRDDKKERADARGGMSLKERAVAKGDGRALKALSYSTTALSLGNGPLFTTALSFLSSRPGFPATLRWIRLRMRLSLKERRMRFANATNINRKSGGAKPRDLQFPRTLPGNVSLFGSRAEFWSS
jgi:hypothetical protein